MITFDITFTADPTAVGGFLEYRYVISDPNVGLYSPWVVNLNVGNVIGYFAITGPTMTFTGVQGNAPDFVENTTYQFRIRQICADGSEVVSPAQGDYVVTQCPDFDLKYGAFDSNTNSYPIEVGMVNTVGFSIVNYIFKIYDSSTAPLPLATEVVDFATVNSNLPYAFVWDSSNVPGGIIQGTTYYVSVSYELRNSSATKIVDCGRKILNPLPNLCNTYLIETGDSWGLAWTDCDGIKHECYTRVPYNGQGSFGNCANKFTICSLTLPIGLYCDGLNGVVEGYFEQTLLNPTSCGTLIIVTNGAKVSQIGVGCSSTDYASGITWSDGTPVICCDLVQLGNNCTLCPQV